MAIPNFPGFIVGKPKTGLTILALFACLGVLYLVPKVLSILHVGQHDYFDFQPMWRAGSIWASGHNPYDAMFYPNYFGINGRPLSPWFYPPYWYPLIVPFGLLPFEIALTIWKIINFILLILATHLIARAFADVTRQKYFLLFLSGITFTCFMYATAVTAWSGQTSILIYFGLSAWIFGLLKARPPMLIVGLVFLALKPQIGILVFAANAILDRYRWTILPAAGICLLSSIAVAITANYLESVEGFLISLTRHSEHLANTPPHVTELIHILYYIFPASGGLLTSAIIYFAAIACTAFIIYNSPFNNPLEISNSKDAIASLAIFIATSLFLVPLHYYDMVSLAILLMMIITAPLPGRCLIAVALLIGFRPDYLLHAIGIPNAPEPLISHLISASLFLLVVATIWSSPRAMLNPEISADPVT